MTGSTSRRPGRRTVLVTVLAVLVAAVVGVAARPAPGPLPATAAGDVVLAELGRTVVGEDRPALAVACVTPDRLRTAVIGAAPTDRFEIGSVSKGVTGLLFADMIRRGEVRADTPLGDLLPVEGPLAGVTLARLATHTSGLPVQLPTLRQTGRNLWGSITAGNPYDGSVADRLSALEGVELTAPPGTYSNLGFELLGAALAAAADRPYRDLVTERVLRPVGATDASVPYTADELTERDLLGQTSGGRTSDAWLGEAIAPAGGIRADVGDLAALTQRLVAGTAPGLDALEPKTTPEGEEPTGWAWIEQESPADGRTVTWHNGGTGGFASFVGLDRERRVGVVVLSARGGDSGDVTRAGFRLLHEVGGCG